MRGTCHVFLPRGVAAAHNGPSRAIENAGTVKETKRTKQKDTADNPSRRDLSILHARQRSNLPYYAGGGEKEEEKEKEEIH